MLHKITPLQLAKQLKNIGPKVAAKLINANITSLAQLKEIGAQEAYIKILESGGFCGTYHAAYLYALEGAIQECSWLDISELKKLEFKEFTADLRREYNLFSQ